MLFFSRGLPVSFMALPFPFVSFRFLPFPSLPFPRLPLSVAFALVLGIDDRTGIQIPIFHCNGDDPMSVCTAFELAVEWRQQVNESKLLRMPQRQLLCCVSLSVLPWLLHLLFSLLLLLLLPLLLLAGWGKRKAKPAREAPLHLSLLLIIFIALSLRQYGEDCIIDMICYRRMGHNEIDQPLFTQPVLYKQIAQHPDTAAIFEAKLVS